MRDLDFFAVNLGEYQFNKKIRNIAIELSKVGFTVIHNMKNKTNMYVKTFVQNIYVNFSSNISTIKPNANGLPISHIPDNLIETVKYEGFWTHFQFIWTGANYEPWSILHIFDLDCSQIGFNGKDILCTYAFLQSINTNTMINYKLSNIKTLTHTFC
eukprot:523582_1